jgi:hypothetical protein
MRQAKFTAFSRSLFLCLVSDISDTCITWSDSIMGFYYERNKFLNSLYLSISLKLSFKLMLAGVSPAIHVTRYFPYRFRPVRRRGKRSILHSICNIKKADELIARQSPHPTAAMIAAQNVQARIISKAVTRCKTSIAAEDHKDSSLCSEGYSPALTLHLKGYAGPDC